MKFPELAAHGMGHACTAQQSAMDCPVFKSRSSQHMKHVAGTLESLGKVIVVEDITRIRDGLARELDSAADDEKELSCSSLDASTCLELLTKLEATHVSLATLTSTKIGRVVNRISKRSKRWGESNVTRRARALVNVWRTTAAAARRTQAANKAKRGAAVSQKSDGLLHAPAAKRRKRTST